MVSVPRSGATLLSLSPVVSGSAPTAPHTLTPPLWRPSSDLALSGAAASRQCHPAPSEWPNIGAPGSLFERSDWGRHCCHGMAREAVAQRFRRGSARRLEGGTRLDVDRIWGLSEVRAHQFVPARKSARLLEVDGVSLDGLPMHEQPILERTLD